MRATEALRADSAWSFTEKRFDDDEFREMKMPGGDTTDAFEAKGRIEGSDDGVEGKRMTSPSKRMVLVELWYWLPSSAKVLNLQKQREMVGRFL
jgi:hypothetical protein